MMECAYSIKGFQLPLTFLLLAKRLTIDLL